MVSKEFREVFATLTRTIKDKLPGGFIGTAAVVFVVLMAIYYPLGMVITNQINDDVDVVVPYDGGSNAVASAVYLIDREVNETTWAANKPWFMPASMLDNMPNYQMGVMYAVSRFAIEMTDQLGRVRGSGQADAALDKASGLLKYDGTIWVWEPSTSLLPTAAATAQYKAGMKSLLDYNTRLKAGNAIYDIRADNLMALLDRIGADLGSQSASLDKRDMESDLAYFDTLADDIFYSTKGRLYGYYMILRGIEIDFKEVIDDKKARNVWDKMMTNLRYSAQMEPLVISNGSGDGLIFPAHMANQGFYLLRARTNLKEVHNILKK